MRGKFTSAVALACALATLGGVGAANAVPAEATAVEDQEVLLSGPGGSYTFGGLVSEVEKVPAATQVDIASGSSPAGVPSGESVLTTTASSAAEAEIAWRLELPEGATAQVHTSESDESSVILLNSDGGLLGTVISESAVDALGADVPVGFAVKGNAVTQTLMPSEGDNISYPVAVSARAGTVWYSSAWVKTSSKGYVVNAVATAAGRRQIAANVHHIHVQHLKQILGSQAYRVNYNIEQQFLCHVVGAWFPSGTYNMESWQPSLPWGAIANPVDRCNRIK